MTGTAGALHPQIQALVDALAEEARLSDGPPGLIELRAAYAVTAERLGGVAEPVRDVVDTDADGVPVRVYVPETLVSPAGAIVYAHGGGWVMGDLDGIDRVCRSLAVASGHVVVSADYRLAPENPFPAGLDDVVSVVRWAASSVIGRRFGHDPARLAVAGDSAGGNLAAAAALREPSLVCAQMLVYPALDASLSGGSYEFFSDGYGLSGADMATAYGAYGGGAGHSHAEISPLAAADLSAVPPAFIAVASHDVLRDDGARYADRLREAGVEVHFEVCDGMVHGFIRWGGVVDASGAVVAAGAAFLDERLRRR